MHLVPYELVMGFLADFWKGESWVGSVNIHEELEKGPWGMQACSFPEEIWQGDLGTNPCFATN